MSDPSPAFSLVCRLLGERTELNPVQIRGTVRLALQEGGLFDSVVTHAEMAVVARRLLARELAAGGVPDAEALCASLAERLAAIRDERVDDTPDAVFARLGLAT